MLLSVRLMTYNHSEHIIECLESIDQQQTDFPLEVVIGDDFSSDNNIEVIQNFIAKNNNERIHYRLLKREINDDYHVKRQALGRLYNFVDIVANCKGKYVALIDGDDYWMDNQKLQKQVSFLESNSEYAMSFTDVKEKVGENFEPNSLTVPENFQTIEDLALKGNYIHTPTVVFRNVIKDFPEEFTTSPIGDLFLYMLLTEHGKIHYLNEQMAVYRRNVGMHSSLDNLKSYQRMTTCRSLLYSYFNKKGNETIADIFKTHVISFFRSANEIYSYDEMLEITKNSNLVLATYDYFYKYHKNNEFKHSISTKELAKLLSERLKKKIT